MNNVSIQYIWIKNWRNFSNTEINFNTKYIIHYENAIMNCSNDVFPIPLLPTSTDKSTFLP